MKSALVIATIITGLASDLAIARPIQIYNYERLLKEADLVVFATPTKTEDTGESLADNEGYLTGQNTTFKINYVLQGKTDSTEMKVFNCRFVDDEAKEVGNGARLVVFRIAALQNGWRDSEYLLFLKRRNDGRYEPVSGQIDPVDSVKEISTPKNP